jgi:hypothetical protein
MDRVPKLQHRKILRGCETHRNAEQLIASAYRLITRQSDCGQGDDKGVQNRQLSQPDPQEICP